MYKVFLIYIVFIFEFVVSVKADKFEVASIFTNNLVLQRNVDTHFWGRAQNNSIVRLTICGRTVSTRTKDGKWHLTFPSQKAGGPYIVLIVCNGDSITLKNVMFGDVWLVGGQSNMEYPLNYRIKGEVPEQRLKEIAEADFPEIRFLITPRESASTPLNTLKSVEWKVCKPETAGQFSAIGYYFAKKMYFQKKIPIGIIVSAWGATPIESWMSTESLRQFSVYNNKIDSLPQKQEEWEIFVNKQIDRKKDIELLAKNANNGIQQGVYKSSFEDKNWPSVKYPFNIQKEGKKDYFGFTWLRSDFNIEDNFIRSNVKLHLSVWAHGDIVWINGVKIGSGELSVKPKIYDIPDSVLQSGKNIISVRLLSYYGTSEIGHNGERTYLFNEDSAISIEKNWKYNTDIEPEFIRWKEFSSVPTVLFNSKINPLIPFSISGFLWYQGESNASRPEGYGKLFKSMIVDWRTKWNDPKLPFIFAQLANYQQKKAVPDDDNWAELRFEQSKALKLPNTAMIVTTDIGDSTDIHPYRKEDVAHRMFFAARKLCYGENLVISGPVYKSCIIKNEDIELCFINTGKHLCLSNGTYLKGFSIAGEDRKFYWANARIKGNRVMVSSPSVSRPLYVRYNWEINPDGNLCNYAGLPASPFKNY